MPTHSRSTSDYYDPSPRITVSRPIVIGGQLGCGARLIGRALCARTGLAFADVDRLIEHEAGASLARLAGEKGIVRIGTLASETLERVVGQRPWGVIVLDQAWPTIEVTALLESQSHFIHVQRDAAFLFETLSRRAHVRDRWLMAHQGEEVLEVGDLAQLDAQRMPLLRAAHIHLDAGREHELKVAGLLVDSLSSVAEADAI